MCIFLKMSIKNGTLLCKMFAFFRGDVVCYSVWFPVSYFTVDDVPAVLI